LAAGAIAPIREISSSRVLLCEGAGDVSFFQHLIELRALPDFFVTCPMPEEPGGRSGFTARLRSLRTSRGFDEVTGILVVSDNDLDPAGSFKEVRKLIHEADFKAPNKPLVATKGAPSTVVLMLPWPDIIGQLETLCLQAMKAKWPDQYNCVEIFSGCCQVGGWGQGKREKSTLRALISHICKSDPNTSLQHAWSRTEKLIPLDHGIFDQLAAFLKSFDTLIDAAE
jgi:hypothetical protein